jgi:hypothetical protein
MATPTIIKDGAGSGIKAGVTDDNALKVSIVPWRSQEQPNDLITLRKLFFSYFTNSASSTNLNINASVNYQDFSIKSQQNSNIFITGFKIILNSSSMNISTNQIRKFGSVGSALTNGISCFVIQSGIITNIFSAAVKSIGDFLTYSNDYENFIDAVSIGIDYLNFDIIFETPISIPEGISDLITIRIQDDLSSLNLFQVLARGYQELIED